VEGGVIEDFADVEVSFFEGEEVANPFDESCTLRVEEFEDLFFLSGAVRGSLEDDIERLFRNCGDVGEEDGADPTRLKVFGNVHGAGVATIGGENLVVEGEDGAVSLLLLTNHDGALNEAAVGAGGAVTNAAKCEAFFEEFFRIYSSGKLGLFWCRRSGVL